MDEGFVGKSEVAQLRRQIALECEASWWALHGLAEHSAQHEFITTRFRRMEGYHQRLTELVGEERATDVLCEVWEMQAMDKNTGAIVEASLERGTNL